MVTPTLTVAGWKSSVRRFLDQIGAASRLRCPRPLLFPRTDGVYGGREMLEVLFFFFWKRMPHLPLLPLLPPPNTCWYCCFSCRRCAPLARRVAFFSPGCMHRAVGVGH